MALPVGSEKVNDKSSHDLIADQFRDATKTVLTTPLPVPEACPDPNRKENRKQGVILSGGGTPTTFNPYLLSVLSPLDSSLSLVDKIISDSPASSESFKKTRQKLLNETGGLITWIVTTGDDKERGLIGSGASTQSRLDAETSVKLKLPVSANPFVSLPAEIDNGLIKTTQTNALINATNFEEITSAVILNGGLVTDLVISTHGSDGAFYLVDQKGESKAFSLTGSNSLFALLRELKSYSNRLPPGARVNIIACNTAFSDGAKAAYQLMADTFGVEIYATTRLSTLDTPALNGTTLFSPKDSALTYISDREEKVASPPISPFDSRTVQSKKNSKTAAQSDNSSFSEKGSIPELDAALNALEIRQKKTINEFYKLKGMASLVKWLNENSFALKALKEKNYLLLAEVIYAHAKEEIAAK